MAEANVRGKLKVFVGAFPGAGKTDAMIAAARRIKDAGREVVIGHIDMHGGGKEKAAIEGFEIIAPAASGELDLRRYAGLPLREFRDQIEREFLRMKLDELEWNISRTAAVLQIERTNLHKRLRALGLSRESKE